MPRDWQQLLVPVVPRYRDSGRWKYLRADAAFAIPEGYEYLEQEGFRYAIRLPAKQWIKEGKYAVHWTRLSYHCFVAHQVRLALFVLAYNLGNFLWRLALPGSVRHWSLRSIQVRLIKIGAKVVRHARQIILQMAQLQRNSWRTRRMLAVAINHTGNSG